VACSVDIGRIYRAEALKLRARVSKNEQTVPLLKHQTTAVKVSEH
jgi:hypothetical protein